ncbi:hypothetical protein SODALDRAFT_331115 [Sodiomyces alkalinus F11]|uniref:Tetratricopeptide SHNi-TPR domain-containing protein n=1 Tax=Sodiomyces alkalinus (strain CBS 110278 / VKM F-3762 / F11) TaxID=1314773 RepID=A0A3N2Q439_SODAK|nr:hypothetical protein SODALDRAFT_331115 [Sodiomyces alkalinus F11]ROT41395.1 hypothetical protein SODALDRAFT_331115 [Sodiomyces alkalinus F11]
MADTPEKQPVIVEESKPTADETTPATATETTEQQNANTPATDDADILVDNDIKSRKVTLADLTAKASALYVRKEYNQAADLYSAAVAMAVDMTDGLDIHPDNGEIFFLYGRSMFKIGQAKSDVLGAKAAGEKKTDKAQPKAVEAEAKKSTQESVAAAVVEVSDNKKAEPGPAKKPLFQFEGDENFEASDEDEEDDEAEDGDEEDEMEIANDTLEIARLSLEKRLALLEEQESQTNGKGKGVVQEGDSANVRHVKERLADTYDLLAEINLENEKFSLASQNFRESLKYKKELYPPESEIRAEAHYKLALALEFASMTTTAEAGADQALDEDLREEAISEMEAAIASTKLKLQAKEVESAETANPEENTATKAQISDVRDMIEDMEHRLEEMRKPAIDFKSVLGTAAGDALQGIFGSALGETPAQMNVRVQDAKKTATDLTGLVRKKEKKNKDESQSSAAQENGHESNGTKRKAEEAAETEDASKKAKVSEAAA